MVGGFDNFVFVVKEGDFKHKKGERERERV